MEGDIPSPSVQAQRFPCFLKTVTENSLKNRMHIPKPFVECYGSELKGTINIEGPSGEVWLAEVSIVDQGLDGYQFGWKAFATDIGLKKGDQLLFTLIAKSHFNVRVFDESGLEYASLQNKGNAVTTADRKRKKREDSDDEILDSKSCHDVHNSGGDEKLTSEQQATVRSFYQDTKGKGGATSGGTLEAEVVGYNSTKDLPKKRLSTRMRGMIAHNKFPEKPNVKPPKPSSKENMQKCAPGLYSQTWESRRRPVTEAERQKTMDAALALKTEYPSVVVLMKPSHVYRGFWLNIPCDFAKSHFPKEDTDLILEDDNGYKWPARWLRNAGRRGLSGGWGTFSRDHFLEEGDVCVYEVVDSCNWRIVVHIFRVVDVKITPGSRGEGCLHYRVVKGAGYQHKSSWKNLKVNNAPMKTHSRKSPHVFSKLQKKQGHSWLKMALQKLSHKATEPKTGMSKAAPEGVMMADDTQVDIKPTFKVQSVSPRPSHCSSAGPILAGDMDKVPNIDVKPGPEQLRPFLKQYYDAARTDTEVDMKPKVKVESGTLKTPPPCCAVPIPIAKMGKVQLPSIDVKPNPEQLKAALRHVCDARSNGFDAHEATLALETLEPSPKPMYKVSRLISRRMKKGAAEREFMVELEGAVANKMQSAAESKNGENCWWIPYSHFSPDFKSCYI